MRKHFPGSVLPARPARCSLYSLEVGTVISASSPSLGLNYFYLTYPESTTKTMPSKVSELSAIFVEYTTFLVSSGAGANTFLWSILLIAPYRESISILGTGFPFASNLCSFYNVREQASSHSSAPVRNTKISPGPSCRCILITAFTAYSVLRSGLDALFIISTGCCRPRTCNTGQDPKKLEKVLISIVADVTTSLKFSL